ERELARLMGTPLPVPPQLLESARSCADWLLMCALRRAESGAIRFGTENVPCDADGDVWDVRLISGTKGRAPVQEEPIVNFSAIHAADYSDIKSKLDFVYPYGEALNLPSKVTATELKGTYASDEAAEEAEPLKKEEAFSAPRRPAFMEGKRSLTAAQKGTAAHIVMQYAEYGKCLTIEGAAGEIERLRAMGTITDEQAAAVRPEVISGFFKAMPGKLILGAEKLWRELKFSLLVESKELFDIGEEKILLQGVVDCCVMYGGELSIIDFKTDYVTEDTASQRAQYYSGQLGAYALAMERMIGLPVKRRILCFLNAGLYREL
ncbi:MAG: PD-(D/E)XK nuclease family protein, partial [Oscillospiraceae bacterium]